MRPATRKMSILALATIIFAIVSYSGHSQGIAFFRTARRDSGDEKKIPTVITSDSLEIDVQNNRATFLDRVKIDDHELIIECDKMTIHLEDSGEKEADAELAGIEQDSRKRISRIVCENNVVITRKVPASAENPQPVQRATAGRADYDVKTGMIVLTQDPVVTRGDDSLKGAIITIWRDNEKVSVRHGVHLELRPEDAKDAQ